MSIAIFGYISRDIIHTEFDRKTVNKIGGKAYYSGVCLANLGEPTTIFIRTDNNSDDLLQQIKLENLRVVNFPATVTPIYENLFTDESLNTRIFKAKQLDKFQFTKDLLNLTVVQTLQECDFIHLAPAYPDELSREFVAYLKENYSAKISADLDFVIKQVDADGNITTQKKEKIAEALSLFDIVLISQEDIHHFSEDSEEAAIRWIANQGPAEVILTKGSEGATIYSKADDFLYFVPPVKPRQVVDATGAGDTFIAAYLFFRKERSIEYAGNQAALITAQKLEQAHAFSKR